MDILDIISADQLSNLRKSGFVVVHQTPTESMLKAMLSAGGEYVNIDIQKAYHRAIAESISIQNKQVNNQRSANAKVK